MPFDWCVSDIQGVLEAIDSKFDGFLNEANLSQNSIWHDHYRDDQYNVEFYHDFDKYLSLTEQIGRVQDKYAKRIKRFYEVIAAPTLFIRYISDEKTNAQGRSTELAYIEDHYDRIVRLLKSFNPNNDIILIANCNVQSEKLQIYLVEPDEDTKIARKPLDKNTDLNRFLRSFEPTNKKENLERFNTQEKRRKSHLRHLYHKSINLIKKLFLREYIHSKQYD